MGNWTALSTKNAHSAALRPDNTLWTWGDNDYGQLGDETETMRLAPVQVGTDADWAQVSAGGQHTLGIKTDQTLWAWGRNTFGQLGDDTDQKRKTPVQIIAQQEIETDTGKETVSYTTWEAVSAGAWHTMGLTPDGKLWAWGHNYYGELGTGDTALLFRADTNNSIGKCWNRRGTGRHNGDNLDHCFSRLHPHRRYREQWQALGLGGRLVWPIGYRPIRH